jgi:predicted DNA-binding transcriptional regulator AlpA
MTLPYPPPFQDLETLAEHICVGQSTIENWVRTGLFPAPKKIGGKRLWEWKAVTRHLANSANPGAASLDQQAEAIRNATRAAAQNPHD